jgi:glycosyltransferase involved in cell wall biosynthesis
MNPTVSVVIATYNCAQYLPAALESATRQTFTSLEVVVVDDGSTDQTALAVRPFLADRRVHYHRIKHAGVAAAKNVGVRLSRAPLVAFLDADDVWMPTKLARQVALFRADPELGVAHTRRWLIDEQGRRLEYEQPTFFRGRVLRDLFRTNFVCFSSAMVRRAVLDAAGLFDESLPLSVDYDLWLRVALRYRFDHLDEPLVEYRTGHANLSSRTEERLTTVLRIMRRFLDEQGGRAALDPATIRHAEAETCYHIGLVRRPVSRVAALPWYLRALRVAPGYGPAWRGLLTLPLPEAVRRLLRRALGRPVDWTVRRPIAEPQETAASCYPRNGAVMQPCEQP